MEQTILNWLLEESAPEVKLRTLKEYEKLPEEDERVANCKKELLQSKVYERGLKKLKKDKPWDKYDAIMAFAEWGLKRDDIGKDIDSEVFALIESTGFKMLCGEPLLLRNLVKLGYGISHNKYFSGSVASIGGVGLFLACAAPCKYRL